MQLSNLISAEKNIGLDELRQHISDKIGQDNITRIVDIPISDGAALAWLYSKGVVDILDETEIVTSLSVSLSEQNWGQFDKLFKQE